MSSLFRLFVALLIMISSVSFADLSAGFSSEEISVPEGISLAGFFQRRILHGVQNPYSRYFKPSIGRYTLPAVETLVIDDGFKLYFFATLEVVAIEPSMKIETFNLLKRKLSRPFELNIFATHTHSGPGGFVKTNFWQQLATDAFIPEVYDSFKNAIVNTSLKSLENITPVNLSYTKNTLQDAVFNRRLSQFLNPQIHILKFLSKTDSNPIATLLVFPIHGTGLGPENLYVSGDIPGLIQRKLAARLESPVMFISGAAGDVGPKIEEPSSLTSILESSQKKYSRIQDFSEKVTDQIYSLWRDTNIIATQKIKTEKYFIQLPHATANLSLCLESLLPSSLRWISSLLFNISLSSEFNRPMEITMLNINPLTMYFIPGEPIGEIGLEIEKISASSKLANPIIMTLANSYFGYILTENEFSRGGYETCNSFYGKTYGTQFINGVRTSIQNFSNSVSISKNF